RRSRCTARSGRSALRLHLDRHLLHLERLAGLAALGAGGLELLQHVHALGHFAEDGVLAVQPRGRSEGEEELTAVGAGAGVGHREPAGLVVLDNALELGVELVPWSPAAVAERIAALGHEAGDHAAKREAV